MPQLFGTSTASKDEKTKCCLLIWRKKGETRKSINMYRNGLSKIIVTGKQLV